MRGRDLLDTTRAKWMQSDEVPSRSIVYTRSSDTLAIPLEALVSGNEFNQDGKDDKKFIGVTFRSLILEREPTKTDTISYNGRTYHVREWDKNGNGYSVVADSEKRNKVSSRDFNK